MANTLESIITAAQQEPADLPRLPAAQVFIHYQRMGTALERIVEAYKLLPGASPQGWTADLTEIIKICESVAKTAERLLEANK